MFNFIFMQDQSGVQDILYCHARNRWMYLRAMSCILSCGILAVLLQSSCVRREWTEMRMPGR